ncbi:MAG: hypothetical protein NTX03_03920 [Bacteroidetes bacterium]|nr:hypothetical protein [Bacteroidota bacterium]
MRENRICKLEIVYGERTDSLSRLVSLFSKKEEREELNCALWRLTKGSKETKLSWDEFLSERKCKNVEYSIEQFEKKHELFKPRSYFPAIFLTTKLGMNLLLSREEIELCEDLESLKILFSEKLTALGE